MKNNNVSQTQAVWAVDLLRDRLREDDAMRRTRIALGVCLRSFTLRAAAAFTVFDSLSMTTNSITEPQDAVVPGGHVSSQGVAEPVSLAEDGQAHIGTADTQALEKSKVG